MAPDPDKRFRPKENPSFEDGEVVCHELGWQLARVRRVVSKYREILESPNEELPTNEDDAPQADPVLPGNPGAQDSADY